MGIQGLHPKLSSLEKVVSIKKYAGKCVAVDGHTWLYRGAYGCAYDITQGFDTDSYVHYFMSFVNMLLFYKVIPIIVFDGQRLPLKKPMHDLREKKKKANLAKALRYHRVKNYNQSDKYFKQAITVTPNMVIRVLKELDKIKVQHIVAPFEADAQLAYMLKHNQVQAVISEDSDLLAFGCSKVIYKIDRFGNGLQIIYDDIFKSRQLQMYNFNDNMFRYMCILSGCDYFKPINDGGIDNAKTTVRDNRNLDEIKQYMQRVKPSESELYFQNFTRANAAFLYQFVFDIKTRTYVRLNKLPAHINADDLVLLGESPQNFDIPILRSNKAKYMDPNTSKHLKKDLFVRLEKDEFDELEFNDKALKELTSHLKKYEIITKSSIKPIKRLPSNTIDDIMTEICTDDIARGSMKNYFFEEPLLSQERLKKELIDKGIRDPIKRLIDPSDWKERNRGGYGVKRKNESANNEYENKPRISKFRRV